MHIRALRPDEEDLFREAHGWTKDAPAWFRSADAVFGWKTFEDYYRQACEANQVSFGVFDGGLIALIALVERAKGVFEAELSAKRGADVALIAQAVREVGNALISAGRVECYVWVAACNRAVLRVCQTAGFKRDGIRMYRGLMAVRLLDGVSERPVEWVRLSSNNEAWREAA
jgi:hypothetical protein